MQKAAKSYIPEYMASLYEKYKSLTRFAIVGCINTGVDFLTFSMLHGLAGMDKLLCQIAGYSMGVINSFIMNKLWTFENRKPAITTIKQIILFLFVNFASLGVSLLGLNYLNAVYCLDVYLSKVIVTLIAQAVNYSGYKLLVFTEK